MSALIFMDLRVRNPQAFGEQYGKPITEVLNKAGGRLRLRAKLIETLEGDEQTYPMLLVVEFPDEEAARAFYASPEYAPLKAARAAHADARFVLAKGEVIDAVPVA